MPSWVWVLIVLALITLIVLGLLWYIGLLGASFDRARGSNVEPKLPPNSDELPQQPTIAPPRTAPRRTSTAIPPPAMAGPSRGEVTAGESPPVARARPSAPSRHPPPAATAAPRETSNQDTTAPAKHSAKPPPAQAAWSEPPERAPSKPSKKR